LWHLVGNESKSYGTESSPPWYSAVADVFKKGLNQRDEQFFIRISANSPLESLMHDSPLPLVLNNLPWPPENR
jgi:hypothetical protein